MKIKNEFFFNKIPLYLTFLLPAFLISGPFLADSAITVCAIIFLINSYKNNLWSYYRNYFFYFFFFFYICINLSSLFSSNVIFSLKTSLPYLRFILFSFLVSFLIKRNSGEFYSLFFISCSLALSLLFADTIFQFFNGIKIKLFFIK